MMIVLMFGGQSRSLRALIIVAAIWPQPRNAKRLQSSSVLCRIVGIRLPLLLVGIVSSSSEGGGISV